MSTRQKDRRKALGVVGSVSRSAGTVVGTVAATGKKVAGFGVRGVAIVRRNGLRVRVAELESDIAAVWRELKSVRHGQKDARPGKKSQGEQAKIKTKTKKPKRSSRPRKRQASKAGAKTKVAIKPQEPQPRVAKVKTSGDESDKIATSTELKTKIRRLESEMEDLKYPSVDLENEYFDD
jgi:hypothetical protein